MSKRRFWPFAASRKTPDCPERLSEAPAGCKVCMSGFAPGGACWREQLQAYGIAPGREIQVIQQSPVTVVRVDHVELAFESSIAREIVIEASKPDEPQLR